MNMKKKHFLAGFAVLSIAAMFMLAGCKDLVTGETNLTGSLKVINEHTGSGIARIYLHENGGGELIWDAPSVNIPAYVVGQGEKSQTFTDVPAGTWRLTIGGRTLDDVVISFGKTTTAKRLNGGNLTAGVPLP